jgi:hypothetical protein
MNATDAFLRQLDDTWSHRWESLCSALDGVTEEEAAWQAPSYADEEREDGWPAPGTIAWQAAHVAHCKRYYTELVAQRGDAPGRPPLPERSACTSFAAIRAELESAHAAQRAGIAALSEADYGLRCGNGMPLSEFLAMAIRHDAWHAAQIVVVRRLFRTRHGSGPPA